MFQRLSLRIRQLLFFVALGLGSVGLVLVGLWAGSTRAAATDPAAAFVLAAMIAGFGILGLTAWIWFLFDANVARPIDALAADLRARAHSDVGGALATDAAKYLGDLAPAAAAASDRLSETKQALAAAIARETARLSAEKQRLEALLSDVPAGVLQCNGAHALVFYNAPAIDLIGVDQRAPGLNRSLFAYLREGPVRLAYERLIATQDPDAVSDLLCATLGGEHLLRARMRLVPGEPGKPPGYAMTLSDVTAEFAQHARQEALLDEFMDRLRRPAANLSTLVGVMADAGGGGSKLESAVQAEVAHLAQSAQYLGQRRDEGRREGWSLNMTRASDLADGLRARMEADGLSVDVAAEDLFLRCHVFELIALVSGLAADLAKAEGTTSFGLAIGEDLGEGGGAMLRLTWRGAPLSMGVLDRWLQAPLEPGLTEQSRHSVLALHGTEIWPQGDASGGQTLCLPLIQARRAVKRPLPVSRAVVYDFDLLAKQGGSIKDSRLEDLTCVVFDTETTGLDPDQGDEIVQIAAVRIVNGRRVEGEVFDTLVNPGRKIPAASTDVHGITDAMVQDAPTVIEALHRFHHFAEGAVLIAHNAPFDMSFLRRREKALGVRFDNPILDTVLLSAVIWGQTEVHTLDALTHRLGISIPEEARHTAIGDTIATAESYLKLAGMLRGKGLLTFDQVLAEVRKHGRLLKDLNPREVAPQSA